MKSSSRDPQLTKSLGDSAADSEIVLGYQLAVEEGPDAGTVWRSSGARCSIGSHPSNGLAIKDPTVSRFHCEIEVKAEGAKVRDLGSRNGTLVDGVRVDGAWLRHDSRLRIGRTQLRFQHGNEIHHLPVSKRTRFGSLVGESLSMRTAFGLLERAGPSDATVLIEGETGTGKEGAARAVHETSPRREKPFVIVDCSAIPGNLLESELFGHERGAFTGAAVQRIGAFEEADGGSIFLDELGELPLELQPKLLRALEQRQIRRVGANRHQEVDVRVIAATNRDLRSEVNDGRFRADLYYRLAVVRVTLPPLRERPEDIPILLETLLSRLTDDPELRAPLGTPAFAARLQRSAWVGNVRELRNYLERCLVLGGPVPVGDSSSAARDAAEPAIDASIPYADARQRALDRFERRYVQELLRLHDDKVAPAARGAGMNRAYLYRLLQKHGLRGGSA